MKRKNDSEDKDLWSRVARSVKPLTTGHRLLVPVQELDRPPRPKELRAPPRIPAPAPRRKVVAAPVKPSRPEKNNNTRGLESDVARRIAKGRTAIEGRIDLHGMTRADAHAHLLDFLTLSRAIGRRTVLVITGKGFAGEGVLRTEVPQWLSTPLFAALVSGAQPAARHHGGEGALYVRLKRS